MRRMGNLSSGEIILSAVGSVIAIGLLLAKTLYRLVLDNASKRSKSPSYSRKPSEGDPRIVHFVQVYDEIKNSKNDRALMLRNDEEFKRILSEMATAQKEMLEMTKELHKWHNQKDDAEKLLAALEQFQKG